MSLAAAALGRQQSGARCRNEPKVERPQTAPQVAQLVADQPRQLPLGGTQIFPDYRIVTHYGTAGTGALGLLGEVPPVEASARLDEAAARYATPDRRLQPAMELIVTIADGQPGDGGAFSHSIDPALVQPYLDAARARHQLLVLDIQPGRLDFVTASKQWEQLLSEPDVGLALDAEWLQRADRFHLGFKVFHTEDIDPLSPQAVLGLTPQPEYISYR